MPVDLPFYRQETVYSCAAACLRMVLAAFGIEASEAELRYRCGTELSGTRALAVLDAARSFGFAYARKFSLEWDELLECVENGLLPIVYVDRGGAQHAIVIRELSAESIVIHDPLETGPSRITVDALRNEYQAGSRTVILVAM